MQPVITKKGVDIKTVNHEKVGLDFMPNVFINCLWLPLIPFGGIVLLINAYLHYNKHYVMCFYNNGLQNVECYKQLNQDERKYEKYIALIYSLAFVAFRLCPIAYYFSYHVNA